MLKGSSSAAASSAAAQQAGPQSSGTYSQPGSDLWNDVPGFGAGADGLSSTTSAERRTEQGGRSEEASSSKKCKVQWQPRDPWRDEEPSSFAANSGGGTSGEEVARKGDGVDEAIRGFNNDPAAAGPVCIHDMSHRVVCHHMCLCTGRRAPAISVVLLREHALLLLE